MRKIIIAASIALLFAACGGDDHSQTPNPTNPPTQGNTTTVEAADIVKFFNLDKQMNVYQALEKAKGDLGKKTINGKEVNVTAVSVVKSNEQAGTFTLKIAGNSGNKPFIKDVDFDGFAQKPTDYEMAMRAVATWKTEVDYQNEFDFDTLYRLKDTGKFIAAYLQKFVNLTSSAVDGTKHYTFTPADWAKVAISEVRYLADNSRSGHIAFTITYNGVKGQTGNGTNGSPSVSFNKSDYYATKVVVNTEETKKLYMRGVYENADVFRSTVLKFDGTSFVPYFDGKNKNDGDNSFDLTIRLVARDLHETELATFTLKVSGFKPLSSLSEQLYLSGSYDLNSFFGKRFRTKPDGDYSEAVKALSPRLWLKLAQMSVKRDGEIVSLSPNEVNYGSGSSKVMVWLPENGSAEYMDMYFVEPRIEVISAKKEENFLYITYKLTSVNETAIDGKQRTMKVHLIAS